MTPKEKAEELINKFVQFTPAEEPYEWDYAKECAKVCVGQVLIVNSLHLNVNSVEDMTTSKYWNQVEKEIDKL